MYIDKSARQWDLSLCVSDNHCRGQSFHHLLVCHWTIFICHSWWLWQPITPDWEHTQYPSSLHASCHSVTDHVLWSQNVQAYTCIDLSQATHAKLPDTHVLIISIDAIKDLDDGVPLTVLVVSISVRYLEVTVIIVGRKIMSNNGPSTDLCLTLCR